MTDIEDLERLETELKDFSAAVSKRLGYLSLERDSLSDLSDRGWNATSGRIVEIDREEEQLKNALADKKAALKLARTMVVDQLRAEYKKNERKTYEGYLALLQAQMNVQKAANVFDPARAALTSANKQLIGLGVRDCPGWTPPTGATALQLEEIERRLAALK